MNILIHKTFQQTVQGEGYWVGLPVRSEIRKYKKMEQEATNLWTKRGIIFND
jgi:hypothetical protein